MSDDVRLFLDEDMARRDLLNALSARGIDVTSVQAEGRMGLSDVEQLQWSTEQGRVLCTFNVRDFAVLHRDYHSSGRQHSGIIVSDQLSVSILLRRLLKLVEHTTTVEMTNRLEFLSQWK